MTSIQRPGAAPAESAAQTQHVAEAGQPHSSTRARFAATTHNNVRFAHARLEHQKSEARSADARRMTKALTKKRQGKAGSTHFSAGKHSGAAHARGASTARGAHQRVTRDGGNGGGRNGGQHSQQSTHDKAGVPARKPGVTTAARPSRTGASQVPVFASHLRTLEGPARRAAMVSAWCDTLSGANLSRHTSASLHDALAQLRTLRQQEGSLPLETLGQVRQSLMDATQRNATAPQSDAAPPDRAPQANATAAATRNLLAPLLALSAALPVSPRREQRAAIVHTALGYLAQQADPATISA
jgi:hypothetical protein